MAGQHFTFSLRYGGKFRLSLGVELLQLLNIRFAALTEIVSILRVGGYQRIHDVTRVQGAIAGGCSTRAGR